MPRNYVKVAEKTKKDAKEDKSLGRISAFFSKTAANGSVSTEKATPARKDAKRAASSRSETSPKKKQVKLASLFPVSFSSAPAESSESSRQPAAKSVSPDQDPQVPPPEETEPGHFTQPIQVESTATEFPVRCIPRLSFVPQFLHDKRIRFVFSGKRSRSTDAASAVAPASSQAPSTSSQVPSSSPSDAPAQDAVPQQPPPPPMAIHVAGKMRGVIPEKSLALCPSSRCGSATHIPIANRRPVLNSDLGNFIRKWAGLPAIQNQCGMEKQKPIWVCGVCYKEASRVRNSKPAESVEQQPQQPAKKSENFLKPYEEYAKQPDRQRDYRRAASTSLSAAASRFPGGAVRAALASRSFVEQHGVSHLLKPTDGDVSADENFRLNLVAAYKRTENKDEKLAIISAYCCEAPGGQAPTRKRVREVFGCSNYAAKKARLHGISKGAGSLVAQVALSRQRMSVEQILELTRFSVDTAHIYMPAHSDTQDAKFLRRMSFKKLHRKLVQQWTTLGIPPVCRSTMHKVLSGKGYGRMRCFTGLCTTCTFSGYRNWEDLFKFVQELLRFADINQISVQSRWSKPSAESKGRGPAVFEWKSRFQRVRDYYRVEFKDQVTLDNRCASLCLRYALSGPDDPPCDHVHDQTNEMCNERLLLFENIHDLLAVVLKSGKCSDEQAEHWREDLQAMELHTSKYIGHLLRDANATQDYDEHILELSDGTAALIADYMMKYEGSKFAEIQSECFAKTKLSVLGGLFMRRITQVDITASPDDLGPEHEFKITHCRVVSDDCNQDWYKFVCDIFAQLKEYKHNNPHVNKVRLTTDGAANLVGVGVELLLMHSVHFTGIEVTVHNRNEPGEGKTGVDSDFSASKGHVDAVRRGGVDVCDARQYVDALNSEGGLAGSVNLLIDYDRSYQPKLKTASSDLAGLSTCLSREFFTDPITNERCMRVRENARIGSGRVITATRMLELITAQGSTDDAKMRALITQCFASTSTKCFHHPATAAPRPQESIKVLLNDKARDAKKVARLAKKQKIAAERAAKVAEQEAKAKALDQSFRCKHCSKPFITAANRDLHENKEKCKMKLRGPRGKKVLQPGVVKPCSGVDALAALGMVGSRITANSVGEHADKRLPQPSSFPARGYGRNQGRTKSAPFDDDQISFLKEMYERGVTGVKMKPARAVELMHQRFEGLRKKWLTEVQIKAWFGSYRQKLKKLHLKSTLADLRQQFKATVEEAGRAAKEVDAGELAVEAAEAEAAEAEAAEAAGAEAAEAARTVGTDAAAHMSDNDSSDTENEESSADESSSDEEEQAEPEFEQTLLGRGKRAKFVPAKLR